MPLFPLPRVTPQNLEPLGPSAHPIEDPFHLPILAMPIEIHEIKQFPHFLAVGPGFQARNGDFRFREDLQQA